MGWIRAKLLEVLEGTQPVSKKLAWLLVALVVVGVVAVSSLTGAAGQQSSTLMGSAPASSTGPELEGSPVNQPVIFVHVVGEVTNPGIYQLDAGSRVFDAIFAAGGLTKAAEQQSVNLARTLTDGEQILIGEVGSAASGFGASQSGAQLVSINRASQIELEALPGVGPALATRIIDYRVANGGFKTIDELKNVGGIGDKLFAGLKSGVTL